MFFSDLLQYDENGILIEYVLRLLILACLLLCGRSVTLQVQHIGEQNSKKKNFFSNTLWLLLFIFILLLTFAQVIYIWFNETIKTNEKIFYPDAIPREIADDQTGRQHHGKRWTPKSS